MKTKTLKPFKVVTVSGNRNSFGLAGVILMAKDGEAYEVGANHLYTPKRGDIIHAAILLDEKGNRLSFAWENPYEIPRELPKAPKAVIKEVWG